MKDLADHILNNPDWIIKIEFDGDGKEIKPEGVTNLFKMTAEHKANNTIYSQRWTLEYHEFCTLGYEPLLTNFFEALSYLSR
jgi:hypothetical protein